MEIKTGKGKTLPKLYRYLDPAQNPFIRTKYRMPSYREQKQREKYFLSHEASERMKRWWKLWKAAGNKGRLSISKIANNKLKGFI
jgi:hypothetical protein